MPRTPESRRESYRWLFKTHVYKSSVDAALRTGLVKTKTEYAVQLWLAYLKASTFQPDRGIMASFNWMSAPQGSDFWAIIHREYCNG